LIFVVALPDAIRYIRDCADPQGTPGGSGGGGGGGGSFVR